MIEQCRYLDLPNCYRLSNGSVELVVATDIGPRILRYALPGEENILAELPDASVPTELGEWKPWGGHRLWAAPEALPRSYAPDNTPVAFEIEGDNTIRLTGDMELGTGLRKEMRVTLDPSGSRVVIEHRIANHGIWGIDLAPWALTIMNGGGETIIPQEPFRPHSEYLLPARPLVLWHYTDLSDPRWRLSGHYIRLRTDEGIHHPQKVGVLDKQGWGAYHRNGTLFVKEFGYREGALYPDLGSNCETYTAGTFMELESLAPIEHLEPGEEAMHREEWHLFGGVDIGDSDETLDAALLPLIEGIRNNRSVGS